MANDELLEQVGKILGLAGALTRSQWRDSHRSRARSGEQSLWMAVLQNAISDWNKHKNAPISVTHAKNAKDLPDWAKSNSLTITLVCEVVSDLFQIDDEVVKKALTHLWTQPEAQIKNE